MWVFRLRSGKGSTSINKCGKVGGDNCGKKYVVGYLKSELGICQQNSLPCHTEGVTEDIQNLNADLPAGFRIEAQTVNDIRVIMSSSKA